MAFLYPSLYVPQQAIVFVSCSDLLCKLVSRLDTKGSSSTKFEMFGSIILYSIHFTLICFGAVNFTVHFFDPRLCSVT